MNRRSFFSTTLAPSVLLLVPRWMRGEENDVVFCLQVKTVLPREMSEEEYRELKREYHNVNVIDKEVSKMCNNGNLLGYETNFVGNACIWRAYFASEEDYLAWRKNPGLGASMDYKKQASLGVREVVSRGYTFLSQSKRKTLDFS